MDIMQVKAAISALYGSDAAEAARANTFLMEFTEQPVRGKQAIRGTLFSLEAHDCDYYTTILLLWDALCDLNIPQSHYISSSACYPPAVFFCTCRSVS